MRCKIRALLASVLALALVGCPTRPGAPISGAPALPPPAPAEPPHLGRPYDIVASESLLTVLVYRAGPLARAGHNHVIAAHQLAGTIYVSRELAQSSCRLVVPVDTLVVDEPELREREAAEDFPREVPESAREGTRHNMLSEALLDAAHYPQVTVSCRQLALPRPGAASAELAITVRDRTTTRTVPLDYVLADGELTLRGELPLRQSELGLTPFTALLGALAVEDEMRVRFRLVARAATLSPP